ASARYHVYKHLRSIKARPVLYTDNWEVIRNNFNTNNSGEENIYKQELDLSIESYLSQLPKRCKEIFILNRKEHLSNDEIASRLKISKRTVENQITHALKHLRLSLKEVMIIVFLMFHTM